MRTKSRFRLNLRIKRIKLLVMDVDGVLTNGKINIDSSGTEIKVFDVKDGFGIALWRKAGLKCAILSARSASAVTARARDLKIDGIYQDAYPKMNVFPKLLNNFNVKENEVCYIADDIPDIEILKRVGLAVAVQNAVEEVKEVSDYVTERDGGDGAVREVIEIILKTQRKWKEIIYLS